MREVRLAVDFCVQGRQVYASIIGEHADLGCMSCGNMQKGGSLGGLRITAHSYEPYRQGTEWCRGYRLAEGVGMLGLADVASASGRLLRHGSIGKGTVGWLGSKVGCPSSGSDKSQRRRDDVREGKGLDAR